MGYNHIIRNMISAKAIIFLILIPVFVAGIFFVVNRGAFMGLDLRADVAGSLASGLDAPALSAPILASKNGTVVNLQVDAAAAQSVFFYANGSLMAVPLYLGKGLKNSAGVWEYVFDIAKNVLPNGDYEVYAQVSGNGDVYNTAPAAVSVNVPEVTNVQSRAGLNEAVLKSDQEVAANNEVIGQDLEKSFATIAKMSSGAAAESVKQFSDAARAIEQLNFLRDGKDDQYQRADSEMRALENDIAELEPNILPLIKIDKLKQLGDLRDQKAAFGAAVADIDSQIKEKKDEKDALAAAMAGKADSDKDKAVIGKILDDLAREVAQLEKDNIASQQILRDDPDNDGLNNILEIKAGTDPFNPDTDGDGALDGDEIANNRNPFEPDEFLRPGYTDPRKTAPKSTNIYTVDKIISVWFSNGANAIHFEGRGLPDSYLAVYIYSVPMVAMVKTDAAGQWSYGFDYPLSHGQHAVYAVRLDSLGQVQARSEPLVFAKTGGGVTQIFSAAPAQTSESVETLKNDFKSSVAFAILLSLAAALLLIGFANRRNREPNR